MFPCHHLKINNFWMKAHLLCGWSCVERQMSSPIEEKDGYSGAGFKLAPKRYCSCSPSSTSDRYSWGREEQESMSPRSSDFLVSTRPGKWDEWMTHRLQHLGQCWGNRNQEGQRNKKTNKRAPLRLVFCLPPHPKLLPTSTYANS
jgi:hypothetical protein